MNSSELTDFSNLALASYATLSGGQMRDKIGALVDAGMTEKQAEEFAEKYQEVFLPTYHDPATDLDVTVFRDADGNVTLAIRGSQELTDWVYGDGQIVAGGAAYGQIVALTNWWLRVSSMPDSAVAQFSSVASVVWGADPVAATGELYNALLLDPDGKIDVVGHSLGGHLAMAFNTLFGAASELDQVGSVYAFNAPGFVDSIANRSFFSALAGVAVPSPDTSYNVINVIADEANVGLPSSTVAAGMYSRPGEHVDIPIENQASGDEPERMYNHSMAILTDSLAVYELLTRIDSTLTPGAYQGILHQAAMGTAASLERIVDALQKLLGVDDTDLPVGNDQRDALYSAIYALQEHPGFQALAGHVRIDADASSIAREDFGAMLSLYHLTPFVLHADDATAQNVLGAWSEAFMVAWEQDQIDTEAKEESGDLNYSERWIADRMQMLQWRDAMQASDNPNWLPQSGIPVAFEDKATGLTAPGPLATQDLALQQQVIFGADDGETLQGKGRDDRLYGGGGNDTINGSGGNDYIEGNGGDDEIDGGIGNDTLLGGAGADELTGGLGNDTLKGGLDGDDISGGEGNDTVHGGQGDDKIEGGEGNDVLYGDTPDNYELEASGDDTVDGGQGNDRIIGGAGEDVLKGGEDDDIIYGDTEDSTDTDVAYDDILVGGDGDDVLYGGAGDDHLYGDGWAEDDDSHEGTDYLDGGAGNDRLYGGAGYDILYGGEGDDKLKPNKGDAYLDGGLGQDEYRIDGSSRWVSITDAREGDEQRGEVYVDEVQAVGGKRTDKSRFVWYSADGLFVYSAQSDPDQGETILTINGRVVINDFKNGDLGIVLKDGPLLSPPRPPIPAAKPKWRDPLILDLGGDGIQTVGLDAGLHFDHDGDGFKEATGWVAVGDGMLMLDRDGNGYLDTGAELFGDFTPVGNGMSSVNGFQALSRFDQNQDGRITAEDPIWSQLKVWRYRADHLGHTIIADADTAGELVGLDELGITAIRLDSAVTNSPAGNGNVEARKGVFEKADGTTGDIAEFRLERDLAQSIFMNRVAIPDDVLALPDLTGAGLLMDLSQRIAQDATGEVKARMAAFIDAETIVARQDAFENLLYAWADVEGIDPQSRSPYFDARKIAFLEKLYGQSLQDTQDLTPQQQVIFGADDGESLQGKGRRTNRKATKRPRLFVPTDHKVGAADRPMV